MNTCRNCQKPVDENSILCDPCFDDDEIFAQVMKNLPADEICDKCNGEGVFVIPCDFDGTFQVYPCTACMGSGAKIPAHWC